MLIEVDAKGLEWVCAVYLSGDKVGREELSKGIDQHADNQTTLGLPTRHLAKIFLFRTIYCDELTGGAFSFSNDPGFTPVSSSVRWWQSKIDGFFTKYSGLAKWHESLLKEVGSTGIWTSPTGRIYQFNKKSNYQGDLVWPKTQIYNYPVQGLGAELMAIVRVSLTRRIRALNLQSYLVLTVHDSILIDALQNELGQICTLIAAVFADVSQNFVRLFDVPFDVPLVGEIKVGEDWGHMKPIDMEILNAYQGS